MDKNYPINVFMNLPRELRKYISHGLDVDYFMKLCELLHNREIDKKKFIDILKCSNEMWIEEKKLSHEERKIKEFPNLKIGDKKILKCQYWVGEEVEVIGIEPDKIMSVLISHGGWRYNFFPSWFD